MPRGIALNLSQRVQQLLDERQQHADALAQIEATLGQIGAAIGNGSNGRRKPGRPPSSASAAPATAPGKKKRRGRGSYSTTADEFVVSFIKSNKNPTSREINAAWKREGRGHTADNTLTKLVKEKQLKRTPLGVGIRGSRYTVA